jgi:hypothetical protein
MGRKAKDHIRNYVPPMILIADASFYRLLGKKAIKLPHRYFAIHSAARFSALLPATSHPGHGYAS